MSELVPADQIEAIVGVARDRDRHYARAVSAEQEVYILHSQRCLDSGIDLRKCPYSLALDRGLDPDDWDGYEDRPVALAVVHDRLFPVIPGWLTAGDGA